MELILLIWEPAKPGGRTSLQFSEMSTHMVCKVLELLELQRFWMLWLCCTCLCIAYALTYMWLDTLLCFQYARWPIPAIQRWWCISFQYFKLYSEEKLKENFKFQKCSLIHAPSASWSFCGLLIYWLHKERTAAGDGQIRSQMGPDTVTMIYLKQQQTALFYQYISVKGGRGTAGLEEEILE